ncbi:MAG: acylneuraminate cytidylyltransferase family protein [bacterium]|nr:acylneuraminate cytidylyltransferase family protein [bacterium]
MIKQKILAIIPARSGSKRIPNKNIKNFLGKPLLAYTVEQALACKFINRVFIDTDSLKIAVIAKKYGAEAQWLRPMSLADDKAKVVDSIIYHLNKLKKEQNYEPDYVMILQVTSPLREVDDIKSCWQIMKKGGATTVLTVCPTQPKLYHLDYNNFLKLVNASERAMNNAQAWSVNYILNGCVYIIKTDALLKEKIIITKKTKAVVCEKWRSVDLDTPEDWALAELLYKNKRGIAKRIKQLHGNK